MKAAAIERPAHGGRLWLVAFALGELVAVLGDAVAEAWQAFDLAERLRAWWWVVTHANTTRA